MTVSATGAGQALRDLTNRDDVEFLVRNFYARAFADPLLGPIFVDVARMDLAAHLPVMCDFWQTVLFAVLLLIFVSSIIERKPYRTVVLGCQMAVLGAFIGFVFIMDHPLKGRSAVDPDAIVQTIALIEGRKG